MKQAVSAQDSQQQFAPGLEPGASSTKLGAEGELGEWGMEAQQSHPYGVAVVPMDPPPPPWRRLVAPPGVKASALQPGKVMQVANNMMNNFRSPHWGLTWPRRSRHDIKACQTKTVLQVWASTGCLGGSGNL